MSAQPGPIRELTIEERMKWGTCPVCQAPHGTDCYAAVGIHLGVRADGRAPQDGDGAHLARLDRAPHRVREVDAGRA